MLVENDSQRAWEHQTAIWWMRDVLDLLFEVTEPLPLGALQHNCDCLARLAKESEKLFAYVSAEDENCEVTYRS